MPRNRKLVSYPKDLRDKAKKKGEALFAVACDTSEIDTYQGVRAETIGSMSWPLATLLFTFAHNLGKKFNARMKEMLKGFGMPGGPHVVFDYDKGRVGVTRDVDANDPDTEFYDVEWADGTKSRFADMDLKPDKRSPSFTVVGKELFVPDPNFNVAGTQTGRFSSSNPPGEMPPTQGKSALESAKEHLDGLDVPSAFKLIEAVCQHWINEEGGGEAPALAAFQKIKRIAQWAQNPDEAPPKKGAGPTHKSYLITVEGGTEPELLGPYDSPELRDIAARTQWNEELSQETDAVFGLDVPVNPNNDPTIFAFTNAFMEEGDESGEADHWDQATCLAYIQEHELSGNDELGGLPLDDLRKICNEHQALQGRDGT